MILKIKCAHEKEKRRVANFLITSAVFLHIFSLLYSRVCVCVVSVCCCVDVRLCMMAGGRNAAACGRNVRIFKWGPKALSLCAIHKSVGLKCRASTRLFSCGTSLSTSLFLVFFYFLT